MGENIYLKVIICYCTCVCLYLGRILQVFVVEQRVIGAEDDPVEESAVQRLRHRVPHRPRLHRDTSVMCESYCL